MVWDNHRHDLARFETSGLCFPPLVLKIRCRKKMYIQKAKCRSKLIARKWPASDWVLNVFGSKASVLFTFYVEEKI